MHAPNVDPLNRRRATAALVALPWLWTGARAQPAVRHRLTPAQTEGPFYPVALPADSDADLLRNGARLVTGVDDIAEELQELIAVPPSQPLPQRAAGPGAETPAAAGVGADEQRLLDALGDEEAAVDDLVRLSGLAPGQVNGLLVGLQIKRRIRLLPGARVKRSS